jgi:predicted AAA+ superfamily ATPase
VLYVKAAMQSIAAEDIIAKIRLENPWWGTERPAIPSAMEKMKPRAYFDLFFPLLNLDVRRAVILLGPRRVGKTVMIHHAIQALLANGVAAKSICYLSVDHPIYNGLRIDQLIKHYSEASGNVLPSSEKTYIFFDEIQYLRKWEEHIKSIVDTAPYIRCVASGSSAAALRLKSKESGAGRFTDFLLPPLTFYEYLLLLNKMELVQHPAGPALSGQDFFETDSIETLNEEFLNYLNFGGYPEVVLSPHIREDPTRFIKSDIIDKVLLRDLPSLYGIEDIQELNYLFTTLAFNTAQEISLNELSQNSGVAKNTIKRYIEYLEAAFLIKRVHRIDHSAKRFERANFFKVYLTNPSLRAALFSPVGADDRTIGHLAETAIYSQWFHSQDTELHYARWQAPRVRHVPKDPADGEVDMVMLDPEDQKPAWAVEVKWSDGYCEDLGKLKAVLGFCSANELGHVLVTTRTKTMMNRVGSVDVAFLPASIYCYTVGYNLIHGRNRHMPRRPKKRVSTKARTP